MIVLWVPEISWSSWDTYVHMYILTLCGVYTHIHMVIVHMYVYWLDVRTLYEVFLCVMQA